MVQISSLQSEITEWQMELSAAEAEVSHLTSLNGKGSSHLQRPQSSGPKNRGDPCKMQSHSERESFLCKMELRLIMCHSPESGAA